MSEVVADLPSCRQNIFVLKVEDARASAEPGIQLQLRNELPWQCVIVLSSCVMRRA